MHRKDDGGVPVDYQSVLEFRGTDSFRIQVKFGDRAPGIEHDKAVRTASAKLRPFIARIIPPRLLNTRRSLHRESASACLSVDVTLPTEKESRGPT